MPWQEQRIVDQRKEFVLRALEPGANHSALCREFGISRPTGYKWLKRYREGGLEALSDESRRPHSNPTRASGEAVLAVLELRSRHRRWGPRKLKAVLERRGGLDEAPSERTIARILERADAIEPRRRRRRRLSVPKDAPDAEATAPNDIWTIDFKGWWLSGQGDRIEPLTVRDAHTRFVLAARVMPTTTADAVREVLQQLFERYGLPLMMKMDNGSPFACTRSPGGLTKLSAWLVSLGIQLVRSRPGCPQDNGAHERMHLEMRYELEDVPADSVAAQQEAIDIWLHEFNHVRPHESLDDDVPGDRYKRSPRRFSEPKRPVYPAGWTVRKVGINGMISLHGERRFVSCALALRYIALRPTEEPRVWQARFRDVDLGTLQL